MRKLRKSRSLKLDDPLGQLITIPTYYAAYFGTNNKDTFIDLAHVMIDAAPSFGGCVRI